MGCDIFVHLEHYNKESKRWENLSLYKKDTDGTFKSVDVYDGRDYELFGILAGVRGCNSPFVYPRGVPDDLSCEVSNRYGDGEYFHTPTWYDYCELNAYEKMMSDSYKELRKKSKEIEQLKKQLKQMTQFIQREEAEEDIVIEDDYDEYDIAERLTGFMNCIRTILEAYEIWNPKPGDVRVIMWFDS